MSDCAYSKKKQISIRIYGNKYKIVISNTQTL